jgi:Skp family chaperone for outer membrane proteins
MRGEDLDHESGQPHTAHIMANCMFLEYYFTSGLNFKFDDRTEHVMKGQRLREELEEVIEAVQADVVKIETDDDELIEALKGSDYKRMNIIQDLQRQIKEKDEQLAKYNKDVDAYTEVLNRIMPFKLDKDNE